jgi:hypothetical protein
MRPRTGHRIGSTALRFLPLVNWITDQVKV